MLGRSKFHTVNKNEYDTGTANLYLISTGYFGFFLVLYFNTVIIVPYWYQKPAPEVIYWYEDTLPSKKILVFYLLIRENLSVAMLPPLLHRTILLKIALYLFDK